MRDVSMHILDIVRNSIRAGAALVSVTLEIKLPENVLELRITDNGCGMDADLVKSVTDPFITSRTRRKVGLGLPFLKMNAEQSDGSLIIESEPEKGTVVKASFNVSHIDCIPLGDVPGSVALMMSGNPDVDFVFEMLKGEEQFSLNTKEIKQELEGIRISHPKVARFIKEMVEGNLMILGNI